MIDIRRDDHLGPDALTLIAASEAELAAIYPPEHRFAFSPDELIAARTIFVVAYMNGNPVGCGGLAPLEGYGELKRIFVDRDRRGKGIADAVVTALEAAASTEGLPLIRLETGEDSPAAIRFYERMGYARRGPFGTYAENGASVFMEKRL